MPMLKTLDLTRTRAMLKAYDTTSEAMDSAVDEPAAMAALKAYADALEAVGVAFALDTADRNEYEMARRVASHHQGAEMRWLRKMCEA